jgi:hypothetical protein
MFSASIIFCATIFGVVTDRCVVVEDTLGPYFTQQNCEIRTAQMIRDITASPELMVGVYLSLDFPQQVSYATICLESI